MHHLLSQDVLTPHEQLYLHPPACFECGVQPAHVAPPSTTSQTSTSAPGFVVSPPQPVQTYTFSVPSLFFLPQAYLQSCIDTSSTLHLLERESSRQTPTRQLFIFLSVFLLYTIADMRDAPWLIDDTATFFPIRAGESWFPENEGSLSVDVYEYPDSIVVRAPIAGVKPGDLDLSLHNDMLTIRGKRTDAEPNDEERVLLHQECHWGSFSRSIILPVAVRADDANASLHDGVLTIRLPKATLYGRINVTKH